MARHAAGKMSDKELVAALESFKPENAPARCETTVEYSFMANAAISHERFEFQPDA